MSKRSRSCRRYETDEARKAAISRSNHRHRQERVPELRAFISRLKEDVPCKDCGGRFPECCMEFDHLDPSVKVSAVSNMVNQGYSLYAVMLEIAKCDLVCANCHRIRHHG